jgi:hypothetical protein
MYQFRYSHLKLKKSIILLEWTFENKQFYPLSVFSNEISELGGQLWLFEI